MANRRKGTLRRWAGARVTWTALAMLLVGCGGSEVDVGPTGDVKGTVVHAGKPVNQGLVTFQDTARGQVHQAKLDMDGAYALPKVPVGHYTVVIMPLPPIGEMREDGRPPALPDPVNIPPVYRSGVTTPLTTEVTEGEVSYDIVLEN
ncbi:carboxypeptidase-like regulatory domain-containing protein [Planctomycetes bacterium Pan216]|uniref:carboxypeptidase-like regulatory domain-containing protein n=1 Tax=Kolteria novifilia TaxID=2527975 RepID=UPI0011A5FCB9